LIEKRTDRQFIKPSIAAIGGPILAADGSWTFWQNRRSQIYTRKRPKNFQGHPQGCRDDREAKITFGSASFVGIIKDTDRERRAAARAETAEGKTAGTEK
jgi:hypothetical protein